MNNQNKEFTRSEFGRNMFANVFNAIVQGIGRSLARSIGQGQEGVEKESVDLIEQQRNGQGQEGVIDVIEQERTFARWNDKKYTHQYKDYGKFVHTLSDFYYTKRLCQLGWVWPMLSPTTAGAKYCLLYAAMALKHVSNWHSYEGWANSPYDDNDHLTVIGQGCSKLGLEHDCLGSDLRKILVGDLENRFPCGKSVSTAMKLILLRLGCNSSEDPREHKYVWFIWAPVNHGGLLFPTWNGKACRVAKKFMENVRGTTVKKRRSRDAQLTGYLWPAKAKNGNPNNFERSLYCCAAYAINPKMEATRSSKRSEEVASSGSKSKRARML